MTKPVELDTDCLVAQSAITDIAEKILGITSFEQQNSDQLDFHDIHILIIKKALWEAYLAGKMANLKNTKEYK